MAKKTSALGKLNDNPMPQVTPPETVHIVTERPAEHPPKKNNLFGGSKEQRRSGSSPLNKLSHIENTTQTVVNNEEVAESKVAPQEKKPIFPKRTKKEKTAVPELKPEPTPNSEPIPTQTTEPEPIDYEAFNAEVEEHEILQARKERKAAQRKALFNKINAIVLTLGCVYLIFLTYGALNTPYTYNDAGEVVPQVMTVDEIQKLHDYNVIATDYLQTRMIYEEVLRLDYRIAAGLEDPLLIAPEYEKVLDRVEEALIQSQALSVTTQYTQVHSMINTWLGNDIAIYCQKMSSAISKNSQEDAALALKYKTIVYNDFSVITANIVAMGSVVNGAEVADIESWSPEKYINSLVGEEIGGT